MPCEVEGTAEFEDWFDSLSDPERRDVVAAVDYLELKGIALGYPQSSDVHGSRHKQMRELRIQHKGRPYRVLYAFDPRRTAILLLGGDKRAMIDGTRKTFRSQMIGMTSTCKS
jgi:hypothetical protein